MVSSEQMVSVCLTQGITGSRVPSRATLYIAYGLKSL